jgi:hypothetical protein
VGRWKETQAAQLKSPTARRRVKAELRPLTVEVEQVYKGWTQILLQPKA